MDPWQECIQRLKAELTAAEFNTWILPLQALREGDTLRLLAPNKFVQDWARQHFEQRLLELCRHSSGGTISQLRFDVGGLDRSDAQKFSGPIRRKTRGSES
jgi:chromosomal replication initiator protein